MGVTEVTGVTEVMGVGEVTGVGDGQWGWRGEHYRVPAVLAVEEQGTWRLGARDRSICGWLILAGLTLAGLTLAGEELQLVTR